MNLLLGLADLVLGASLIGLGWSALCTRDLFAGCVRFIAFGLVMALVWARLRAPDIALAEAAIGAGLTGALLLAALRGIGVSGWARPGEDRDATEEPRP